MRNREWMETLTDKELADFFSCGLYVRNLRPFIGNVPIREDCVISLLQIVQRCPRNTTALLSEWLKDEQEFEAEFKYKYQFLHSYKISFSNVKGALSYLNNKTFKAPLKNKQIEILTNIFTNLSLDEI